MFKNVKRLLIMRVFCVILAAFTLNLFSFLFNNSYGFVVFSILITLVYMFYVSSVSFENGTKDKRYSRFNPLNAVLESLLSEIPAALLLIWLVFSGPSFKIAAFAYDLWQAPFWSVLSLGNSIFNMVSIKPVHVIVLFFIPALYGVSYFIGGKSAKLLTPENTQKK